VDFRNFEYHPDFLGETVRVKDGAWSGPTSHDASGNYVGVKKIVYGDLKGDGQEEAVVWTESARGGMSPNAHEAEIFVFVMSPTGPSLLGSLWFSDRGGGEGVDWSKVSDVGVSNGQLTISYYGTDCMYGGACTDWVAKASFAWNGSGFVRASLDRQPVAQQP
jgi:hypothetical protein